MQSFEQLHCRDTRRLPAYPPIALTACEHKVPNTVDIEFQPSLLEYMREEVVDVRITCPVSIQVDCVKAIETSSFLITVQCLSAAGYRGPAQPFVCGKQRLYVRVIMNRYELSRHTQ